MPDIYINYKIINKKEPLKSLSMLVALGCKLYNFARKKCMAKINNAAYYILYIPAQPRRFTYKKNALIVDNEFRP